MAESNATATAFMNWFYTQNKHRTYSAFQSIYRVEEQKFAYQP